MKQAPLRLLRCLPRDRIGSESGEADDGCWHGHPHVVTVDAVQSAPDIGRDNSPLGYFWRPSRSGGIVATSRAWRGPRCRPTPSWSSWRRAAPSCGRSTCGPRRTGRRPPGRGIHHAALICSDVEQTIRFYQDLLGFPLVELVENRDYQGSSHFFFDLGNKTLLGFFDFPGLGLEPGVESIGSVQHIAISCPAGPLGGGSRSGWTRRASKYAGPDLGIPESMYFKDPDGIQIELLSDPLMYFGGQQLDE